MIDPGRESDEGGLMLDRCLELSKPRYAVFVNSCDSFSDCWEPFFRLFTEYWPGWCGPIYLNTERSDVVYPGLDIIATKVWKAQESRPTWSQCLERGLRMVPNEQVLYLQEDYFLNAPVKQNMIDDCSKRVLASDVSHVRLTPFADSGPYHATTDALIWQLDRSAEYLVSMQAALWRKNSLMSQLRSHESAWHFEIYGTKRARRRKERVLGVDKRVLAKEKVFSYVPTGIVKGRWNREAVQDLFAEHAINVDFSRRGFLDEGRVVFSNKRSLLHRVADRLRSMA